MDKIFDNCTGFQWDKGNSEKNWERHKVTRNECEQVFFNIPLIISDDTEHSVKEKRWYLLGQTDSVKLLFVAFTIRKNLIRVISARDMNKKEKDVYYEQIKKYS
jgi:uncharacterized DUF497 family protein